MRQTSVQRATLTVPAAGATEGQRALAHFARPGGDRLPGRRAQHLDPGSDDFLLAAKPAEPQVKVLVAPVTGAPSDGNRQLTSGMRRALGSSKLVIVDQAEEGAFTVVGTVNMTPIDDRMARLVVKWIVKDPAGKNVGDIEQSNPVPLAAAKGSWAGFGDIVASAASEGVLQLLEQAINAERFSGASGPQGTEVLQVAADARLLLHSGWQQFDRVVNVAGPWSQQLLKQSGLVQQPLDLVRGSHLLLPPISLSPPLLAALNNTSTSRAPITLVSAWSDDAFTLNCYAVCKAVSTGREKSWLLHLTAVNGRR